MKISKYIYNQTMVKYRSLLDAVNQLCCDLFSDIISVAVQFKSQSQNGKKIVSQNTVLRKKHTKMFPNIFRKHFWFPQVPNTLTSNRITLSTYNIFNIPFRDTILEMNLDEVLLNIHDTADNTAWELIDQALTILKDIAPYSKKSDGSTIQSDDGSGPSTSHPSDKSVPVKRK